MVQRGGTCGGTFGGLNLGETYISSSRYLHVVSDLDYYMSYAEDWENKVNSMMLLKSSEKLDDKYEYLITICALNIAVIEYHPIILYPRYEIKW